MKARPLQVSLVAIPEAVISTLGGIYDVLSSFEAVAAADGTVAPDPRFEVDIVGEADGTLGLASGIAVTLHRTTRDVGRTDIVIVPSLMVRGRRWEVGRYPHLVDWLIRMHAAGAVLCSACSGLFLLAETGLFDDEPATVHWAFAETFSRTYPGIPVMPEKVLIVAGERGQLISSGASTSWHDLVLHLISERVGTRAALAVARYYALDWHGQGLAPYFVFTPVRDHGDSAVLDCQDWLEGHFTTGSPVEAMARRSGLASRTFKRRFTKATGLTPIAYVQKLRIEAAKRLLEESELSIDEISWRVGYEEPAFFRRLFRRVGGITPGAYRRKFKLPDLAVRMTDAPSSRAPVS